LCPVCGQNVRNARVNYFPSENLFFDGLITSVYFETCLGTTYTSLLVSSLRILLSFPNSGKTHDQNLILEYFQLRLYTNPLFQMNLVFLSWLDSLIGPSPPL